MCELIEEARVAAFAIALDGRDNTAALIRRLADALERSQAENERLRRERDRLFAIDVGYSMEDVGLDRTIVIKDCLYDLTNERTIPDDIAAALAAHDREQQP